MDIAHAMAYITTLERNLEISSIVVEGVDVAIDALSAKRVYDFTPDAKHVLEPPCWINSWTQPQQDSRALGTGKLGYAVHAQFFLGKAIAEAGRQIATCTAFHTALVNALRADIRLGGTVTFHEFHGGDPTLCLLKWGGFDYVGLDEYLDLTMWEKATFR